MRALSAAVLAAALVVGGCAATPAPPEMFDYAWSVQTPEADEVSLERFRGRVLVLNLWATWCPPCVAELPSLAGLAAALAGTDVVVLAVSPEDPARVADFARRHEPGLPLLTEARRAPASLGPLVLPTTFVVDRDGRVVWKRRGARAWDDPEVVRFVRSLAGPPREGR